MVVGSVHHERAGSAASMSETGNYFGSSPGLDLTGAVAATIFAALAVILVTTRTGHGVQTPTEPELAESQLQGGAS
jgi:hypothetical protein